MKFNLSPKGKSESGMSPRCLPAPYTTEPQTTPWPAKTRAMANVMK
jgi:hypothetical protein